MVEARLLAKYKDLTFCDPDDKVICTVYHKNLDFVKKYSRAEEIKEWVGYSWYIS